MTDCENCITNETEAYRAQAEILFPNDQDSQLQFIDAGVASSCQFRCSQWAKQEDRPLAPEYDPPFVF